MATGAIGRHFDSADDVFNWANGALTALILIKMSDDCGLLARLLEAPASVAELAAASDLPADKLGRIMDFLVAHELLEARADGLLHATARTAMAKEAAIFFRMLDFGWKAGAELVPALRSGKTPFELAFGEPVFPYFANHPKEAAEFGAFMGWMTRRVERFILTEHAFQPFQTVADIGGNGGDLLLGMLRHYPGTRGILFDLPEVVDRARPVIATSPLADRVEIVAGSFFDSVPQADLYLLKQILHDWHDDECRQILGSIRAAIPSAGRLAVIDHLLSDVPAPDESQTTDIKMLLWDSGRERKRHEMEALLVASGFRLDRVTANPAGHSVIEAVPI